MGVSLEKRLFKLEDELKSLKSTYTISGGLIELYESESPVFQITAGDIQYNTIIKFTPNYLSVDNLIIPSIYYECRDENNNLYNFSPYVRISPPTDNYILLNMPALVGTIQLRLISNIPGNFTRVQ